MQCQHIKPALAILSRTQALQRIPPRIQHHVLLTKSLVPRRTFIGHLPTVLVPPAIFVGLGIGLWTWKCMMMVVFQNRIIYMPGLPPNARREKISDYAKQCVGVRWREVRIKSLDGIELALCVTATNPGLKECTSPVYVLYFQGNASSMPPRLPFLSHTVRALEREDIGAQRRYVFVCVSYRGYWTSQGRASERGIAKDSQAALNWISSQHPESSEPVAVVIWGQSIGAGVAATLAANHDPMNSNLAIKSLILETPFTNIRDMLYTLYPQKWLPYQYLWPFLRNHLDSLAAMRRLGERERRPDVALIVAGKDELVPCSHGLSLEKECKDLDMRVARVVIANALHTEVVALPAGRAAIVEAIRGEAFKGAKGR